MLPFCFWPAQVLTFRCCKYLIYLGFTFKCCKFLLQNWSAILAFKCCKFLFLYWSAILTFKCCKVLFWCWSEILVWGCLQHGGCLQREWADSNISTVWGGQQRQVMLASHPRRTFARVWCSCEVGKNYQEKASSMHQQPGDWQEEAEDRGQLTHTQQQKDGKHIDKVIPDQNLAFKLWGGSGKPCLVDKDINLWPIKVSKNMPICWALSTFQKRLSDLHVWVLARPMLVMVLPKRMMLLGWAPRRRGGRRSRRLWRLWRSLLQSPNRMLRTGNGMQY